MNELFLFVWISKLSNYADDNTLCASDYNLEDMKEVLLKDINDVTELFYKNYMVLNAGKCYRIMKYKKMKLSSLKISFMNSSKEEKILGVL